MFCVRPHFCLTLSQLAYILTITYMLIVACCEAINLFIYFLLIARFCLFATACFAKFSLLPSLGLLLIFGQMSFHVQCQMIGTRKTALADNAFERFGAGVFAIVTRQFVRARKTPFTLRPLAGIGLLTWKR